MSDQEPNLDSLFEAAVQIESAAERAAFLERACGNDAELRRQVEQLMQSHEQAGSFLDKPPAGLDATTGPGASDGNLAASLEAGLASAFGEDEAVVVGGAGNSVLKMLGLTMDVPHVALRDAAAEGDDPVQRPSSPEIPRHDTDSRYQLQGEIARGGMGAIIKGRDTDLGRDLAIKVLLEEHRAKPEVIQRFVEEAQIGGQLQHPGITPVYELGQFADQRPFFSMKLVKGKTLSALLEERADPAVDRMKLLGTFEQVCQTMAYAHSRGVIHRDLKPANIMVGAFGEVQVMDWGLAKVLPAGGVADEKKASTRHKGETVIQTMRDAGSDTPDKFGSAGSDTQMGSIMGTPAYMPPEQALGEVDRLDERADVFGLGAILCEILTGNPPYVAADATQVFRMARRGKLDECFARLDACSAEAELIDLAKRALAAEPEHRYRNASAMADSITGYLASVQERLKQAELAKAEANARAEHATRRRRLVMTIAGLMLVIAVGAGFSALEFRRQREAKSVLAAQNFELAEENDKKREEAENATRLVEIEKRKVESEREALRQEQYLSDMLLVQQAHESGSVGRVRELLNKHIPLDDEKDRRTFEWYYWWRASHNERESIALTTAGISEMIVSPDQRFIATFGVADRLEIRDARTLELIAFKRHESAKANLFDAMMRTHGGLPQLMAFSHDGAILATVNNNEARLWDTSQLRTDDSRVDGEQELTQLSTIRRAGKINAIAFSPTDTSLAVTEANGQITIWNPQKPSAQQVEIPNESQIASLAFSPDSTLLAALPVINPQLGQDSRILIYDLKQRKLRKTLAGRQRQILSLAWGAAAGRSVIATGSNVGNICLWDGETSEDRDTLTAAGQRIAGLTFSPDGSRLAAKLTEEQAIQIWQTDNSQVVTTIRGHDARVVGAGFIEQAKGLVSCGTDGSVKTWNLSETRPFLEAGIARNPAVSAQTVIRSMDANGDGKISRNEAMAELKPSFDQYDKNKDGSIDESEAQVMVAGAQHGAALGYVQSMDKDGDGKISKDEASEELKPHFEQIDANKDGVIDAKEAQVLAGNANGLQGQVTAEQIVGHVDRNGDGKISRGEAAANLKPYFEQYDANKDGVIDAKEAQVLADYATSQQVQRPATAEQIVGLMDNNDDGKISKDEASEELKPHFEQIDANKDGVIDAKEAQVLAGNANGLQGQVTAEQIVGPMDRNGDGKISRDEASAELKPYFEKYDANKDGVIDAKEAQVLAYYTNSQQVQRPATAERIVGLMDNNDDGMISKDEASEELKPYFEQIDANKDGVVDAKEAQVLAGNANGLQGQVTAEQIVGYMDRNGDGKISKDEAPAYLKPYFDHYDSNKDGVIAGAETQQLVTAANAATATSGQGNEDRMLLKFGRVGPFHRSLRELLHLDFFVGAAESTKFTGLSDNGEFLAVLKPDGDSTVRLELWQLIDSQRQLNHEQDGIPASINRAVDISVADDGSRVAFASPDLARGALPGGVAIHDVATGSTVFADTPSVRFVALSPDGNRLAAMHGRPPRLWVLDIADGKIRDEDLEAGQRRRLGGSSAIQLDTQMATDCVFSPDGQYLAVATDNTGIAIIDCQSIEKIRNLQGHTRGVYTLAFSPDGSQLCSGGEDGTVRVWGFPSGQRRQTLRGHDTAVTAVVFSGQPGDGQSITSMDAMGRILVWPTATKAEIENHAEYWKARAEKHERNGDAANAGADWIRYFALNPNAPDQKRFEILTKYAQWQAAAEAGSRMVAKTPDQALSWLRVAPVIALTENEELYRQFCSRMAKQFAKTKDIVSAQRTCKACLLIPGAIDIEQLPHNPISTWLDEGKAPARPGLWSTRGLVAYRRGNAQLAITHVNKSEELNPPDIAKALNRAIRALARHRLGELEQAREDVQQGTQILDRAEGSDASRVVYYNVLIARILLNEAGTLIEGDAKPSNRAVP